MATEEEKRLIRAYNIGYQLSAHEPKLLEQIIRHNKNNEFVKIMDIARDHQEFERGIPRKDHNRDYKNGFRNARALSEHDPKLLDGLINNKDLNQDFVRGLTDGRQECKIRQTMNRMKQERDQQQRDINRDYGMEY